MASACGSTSDVQPKNGPPRPTPPRSAALLGGRRRDRGRRGRTVSATTPRTSLSPALCGVGPGRVLELCSSLHQPSSSGGRLEDHVGSHESHMIQQQQRLSTSLPAGGYLRSARLYPLGIVETPPIQPSECLGIVSTSARRESWRRPSSGSGGSRMMPDTQRREERGKTVVTAEEKGCVKNQSFSAVALNSRQHSRLIVLPKNTALIPTASPALAVCAKEEKADIPPKEPQVHLLPPVLQSSRPHEAESEMRVEIRSCRQSKRSIPCNKMPESDSTLMRLPDIAPSPQQDRGSDTNPNELSSESGKEMLKQFSVVSIGETTAPVQERHQRHSAQRKHRLSEGKQGKLSLGWSPTRPVGSVTGSAIYHHGQQGKGKIERQSVTEAKSREIKMGLNSAKTGLDSAGEAAISRDCIHIDVHEYLANIHV